MDPEASGFVVRILKVAMKVIMRLAMFLHSAEYGQSAKTEKEIEMSNIIHGRRSVGLPTSYNCGRGLAELIRLAIGPENLGNINSRITEERFPLRGTGTIVGNMRVEPFLYGETGERAANRLTAAGYILADTGDLAGFLHDHPKEVEKYTWVVALAKTARWTSPDGNVNVPYAHVKGASRSFRLGYFRGRFGSASGVLVLRK